MVGVDGYHSLAYQFYFPLELCGMLIGKYGRHINGISRRSGAEISVRAQPNVPYLQLVSIEGTESQINDAVHAIKQRFPTNLFPQINYENINESSFSPDEPVHIHLTQLFLADDSAVDVIVSSVVAPDHIFVQQPSCDSFHFLQMQNCLMQSCYEQSTNNVPLPRPVLENTLCAAPMFSGWFRALVISYNSDSDECFVRFVDYGGYAQLGAHLLQQIRSDFTSLPFQAVECYLADIVAPIDNLCYPHEAKLLMEQLVRSRPLVAQVVGYTDDGVTSINLFSSFNDELYNITDELVAHGVARKKVWPVESTINSS
jgi:A-kinase anchor protein 1